MFVQFVKDSSSDVLYIVAANRDELVDRKATTAHFWDNHNVFAGQDLVAKGTWLGILGSPKPTKDIGFRFGVLTNKSEYLRSKESEQFINEQKDEENLLSRGRLVLDYLNSDFESFTKTTSESRTRFPGYNLLLGDSNDLFYLHDRVSEPTKLQPGIYCLSNGYLDSNWCKMNQGKKQFKSIIDASASDEELLQDLILKLLSNDQTYPPEIEKKYVKEHINKTGIFVKPFVAVDLNNRTYGTRYQSAFIVKRSGEIIYKERVMKETLGQWSEIKTHKLFSSVV